MKKEEKKQANPYAPVVLPSKRRTLLTTSEAIYDAVIDATFYPITGGVVIDPQLIRFERNK